TSWFPEQSKDERVWLIDADGHSLSLNGSPLPENKMVDQLLIQMNILNGRVDWVTQHIDKVLSWISEDPSQSQTKSRMLFLQALQNREKASLLLAHPRLLNLT
ncbi:MAG TPA: hypothetical protein VLE96_03670, partial [Chlamydiales bacterium]|nr:hypothetical protein [Chlamydiales bacterium]